MDINLNTANNMVLISVPHQRRIHRRLNARGPCEPTLQVFVQLMCYH